MEFIKQNRVAVATTIIVIAIIGVVWLNQRSVDIDKKEAEKTQQQTKKDEQAAAKKMAAEKAEKIEKSRDYTYTAAAGDSYTVFARHGVQAYAKVNDLNLSKAQIIAAETIVTRQAQSPYLDIGDHVTIENGSLKQATDTAKNLSMTQLAAWEQYVPYVVFS